MSLGPCLKLDLCLEPNANPACKMGSVCEGGKLFLSTFFFFFREIIEIKMGEKVTWVLVGVVGRWEEISVFISIPEQNEN